MTPISFAASSRSWRERFAAPVSGMACMMAAEIVSGAMGFFITVRLARQLGPSSFAGLEFALALSAWLLVLVRSGIEQIVWREAARRPRLIRPLADLLLSLKLASAILGYVLILVLAVFLGPTVGSAVAVAGLMLPVSALTADVGPRALGEFRLIALGQFVRTGGWACAIGLFVSGPSHQLAAIWCSVFAEALGALPQTSWHVRRFRYPRPRLRRRAWGVFLRRGFIASVTRFGRVTVYGADLLILGALDSNNLGPYAAARRVVFALVAVGLVVPTILSPILARTALTGGLEADRTLRRAVTWQLWASVGVTLGLALGGERWMAVLFGAAYQGAGRELAVVAARLPWLLLTSLGIAALIAGRRENAALGLVIGMMIATIIVIPSTSARSGAVGVGWAIVAIEAVGAAVAFALLRKERLRLSLTGAMVSAVAGSVLMLGASGVARSWPHAPFAAFLASAYSLPWVATLPGRPGLLARRART
jgi:O-antigen/teichoic acid export membrane protein